MNRERLLQLANYLDTLPAEQFDFSVIARKTECGTVGCAWGHAPAVWPETFEWKKVSRYRLYVDFRHHPLLTPTSDVFTPLYSWFDLSEEQADFLFQGHDVDFPDEESPRYGTMYQLPTNAGKEAVASSLRQFCAMSDEEHEQVRLLDEDEPLEGRLALMEPD